MQAVNVVFLVAAIIVTLLQGGLTYEIVGDLSTLRDQYQSLLTTLEDSSSYDTSIATLLGKLDTLQYSPSPSNTTLEWFTPPKDIQTHPPLRITIVVSSFEGMFLNSGIGTFYSSLSDFLLQRGHSVTILYADNAASDTPAFTRWSAQVARRGAKAVRLGAFPIHLRLPTLAQLSYQVYEYLKNHQTEFDLVHFPEWEGLGYYSMLAKKDYIAFSTKLFIVGIHGPWRWVKSANYHTQHASKLQTVDDMETDWMERKSVEMSDMVWTPSSDIITWLQNQGWGIHKDTFLMPYLPGREVSQLRAMTKSDEELAENINEIVFFGRLETRKGLELFADALDRLAVTRPEFAGTKITFLGRSANIGNQTATAYIDERFVRGAWPFKIVYVSHKDRKAALEYLHESDRVAVIPSLVDNTPYTVYECLFANIPFIASNIPSIASIISPSDRSATLFDVDSISLARKLEDVLDNGVRIAKSSLLLSQIETSWNGFYAMAHQKIQQIKADEAKKEKQIEAPLVSVCITHFNRPHFLRLALESIEKQSYKNFEVILVDDGSTSQAANDFLSTLEPKFESKQWKLIRSTNQYLGAARNKAASYAKGDYLFFLDDDNLATSNLLSTYVKVALDTRGDVFTAAHDVFEGNDVMNKENVVGRWVPLGGSPLVGLFKNCFGDANFFIKSSVFKGLKGFTEDKGVGQEDHEFLAKVVLDRYSLVAIPEPLLCYRMHNQSEQMLYTTDSLKNALRAHRPYRILMEESGIEVTEAGTMVQTKSSTTPDSALKMLAYTRAYSKRDTVCNLTVSGVTPSQIPARSLTTLTFTTTKRDCDIENIRIGDSYNCVLTGTPSPSSFSCKTNIPIPGNYPINLKYTSEITYRDTLTRVTVVQTSNPSGATTALTTLSVYREAGQFKADELLGLMAAQTPGAPKSSYSLLSDTVTPVSSLKRSEAAAEELHTSLISITNLNPSAYSVFSTLFAAIKKNSSCLLPYRFSAFSLNAICDASGQCSCSQYFVGTGCTTPVRCPNDCSNNGACVDGTNGKVCQCNSGWGGNDCGVGLCPNNCNNHGDCRMSFGGGNATCSCYTGWNGTACNIPNCPGGCNGNRCDKGVCQCPLGTNQEDCSVLQDNSGKIGNVDAKSADHSERNLFIGIFVMFVVLCSIAGAAVYHTHQRQQRKQRAMEED